MKNITIGSAKMPLNDFVVSRNAILGITKSGKTYSAKGVAEQLLDIGIPIVVFDAIGVWRYLKTPGLKHGYKVVVAGGEQPDLPLTVHSAPAIVRAAISGNIPLVIDLYDSKLSKADWRRIVQDCFRILLYENKGMRHIFLEEAAEYAPQKVMDGQTYAEVEKLARMGGNRSLGITFINQRAQELNKAVLELCDNIILLRQRGTHAIDSLEKQMDKLSPTTAKEIALSLPNMTQGDCWVFTENMDEPIRTRSATINSFHPDRRNPDHKVSTKSVDATSFIETMSGQLEKLIASAKENDPAEMRKKIAELERQLIKTVTVKIETKEVSVLTEKDREILHDVKDNVNAARVECNQMVDWLCKTLTQLELIEKKFTPPQPTARFNPAPLTAVNRVPAVRRPVATHSGSGDISGGMRRMMVALAQRDSLTKRQLGVRAGLSSTSGTFGTYLGKLRSNGWIEGSGDSLRITDSGRDALGGYEPLPEGEGLLNYWLSELGDSGVGRMLRCLAESHPNKMTKEELGIAANISHTSGTFGTYLGKLRLLELIEGKSELSPSSEFYQ